ARGLGLLPKQSVAWTVVSKQQHGQDCPCYGGTGILPVPRRGVGETPMLRMGEPAQAGLACQAERGHSARKAAHSRIPRVRVIIEAMHRWALVGLLGCLMLAGVGAKTPTLQARAAILLDAETGQVLYAKNAHTKLPPASLTKIMTALIVLERCDLDALVKASQRAVETQSSSMHLRVGEQVKVRDLLYALMLRSANDAAVALAEYTAGSVEAFAELMNAKARALGATNTHFVNPHGLHDPRHLSTAYDLALITRYAMQNETFRQIVKTPYYIVERSMNQDDLWMVNKAKFLKEYAWAEGVKTGYTKLAGFCFAGAAYRDGRRLITVVLNSSQREADTIALMEHGFNDWERIELPAGAVVGTCPVEGGVAERASVRLTQPLVWVVPKAQRARYRWAVETATLRAPLRAGDPAGWLVVYQDGQPFLKSPVVAAHEVARASILPTSLWATLLAGLAVAILRWRLRGLRRRRVRAYRRVMRGG
ncbi:MAG: D-alanyl-D-alanine carboxypeptidase, partial [Fimbriimonadales bacterium]|nr:D-alanyl-D-alanine carboxypeptidase [Fimbriimonadales bacterium]